MKRVYDSSSLIDIWEYYLPSTGLFPEFWKWLLDSLRSGEAVVPVAAFEELEAGAEDFAKFLLAKGVEPVKEDSRVKDASKAIQNALGTGPKGFPHPGVGEADIIIMATAKALQAALVSEELQDTPPKRIARYKMPSVCGMEEVGVECTNIKGFLAAYAAILRQ